MIIFILGLGRSGQEASKLALIKSYQVFAFDETKITELNKKLINNPNFQYSQIETFDHSVKPTKIVISPGISTDSKLVKFAQKFCCPIISEVEFANQFNKRPIIAVTGTNGKSTVVEMIVYLLQQTNRKAIAIGNHGIPYSQFIHEYENEEFGILEISSFQLERTSQLKPEVAILTNLSSDHQERYSSFDNYIKIKLKIFQHLTPKQIIISEECQQYINKQKISTNYNSYGFSQNNYMQIKNNTLQQGNITLLDFKKTLIQGNHNYLNAAAAISALLKIGLPIPVLPLNNFLLAEHHQEIIHTSPLIINDSKSTNPHSLQAALQNFSTMKKRIRLIAGGRNKKMNFSLVNNLLSNYVEEVYLYGETSSELHDCWSSYVKCKSFDKFEIMIKQVLKDSSKNEIILFSPACASHDLFTNYQERGKIFKKLIKTAI